MRTYLHRCREMHVSGEGKWGAFSSHRCEREGSIERDGKWYCKTHDPVAIKEKQEAAMVKFRLEIKTRHERPDLLNRIFSPYSTEVIQANEDKIKETLKSILTKI